MAKKSKTLKFLKEVHTPGRLPNRRGGAKPAGLYLLELRSHIAGAQLQLPKRKLLVPVDAQDGENQKPEPVKITHT
jgi:hypothetical protein